MPEETNLTTQTHSPLTWVIRLPQTNHTHTASIFSFQSFDCSLFLFLFPIFELKLRVPAVAGCWFPSRFPWSKICVQRGVCARRRRARGEGVHETTLDGEKHRTAIRRAKHGSKRARVCAMQTAIRCAERGPKPSAAMRGMCGARWWRGGDVFRSEIQRTQPIRLSFFSRRNGRQSAMTMLLLLQHQTRPVDPVFGRNMTQNSSARANQHTVNCFCFGSYCWNLVHQSMISVTVLLEQVFFGLIPAFFGQRFTSNLSKRRQIWSLPAQQKNRFWCFEAVLEATLRMLTVYFDVLISLSL